MDEAEKPSVRLDRALDIENLALADENLPRSLWHYTTAAAVSAIAGSQVLRTTHVSFLNDPSEIEYARGVIDTHLKNLERTSEEKLAVVIKDARHRASSELSYDIYVLCFTTLGDDLSQWRAYGGSALERYSLGFNPRVLRRRVAEFGDALFGPIEYDPAAQVKLLSHVLDRAVQFLRTENWQEDDQDSLSWVLGARLARIAPFLKHPAYRAESEWRIVVWRKPWGDNRHEVQFDASRGVLRPFVAFPIGRRLTLNDMIVMAPTRPVIALKAAKMLMDRIGNSQAVPRCSAIPFAE